MLKLGAVGGRIGAGGTFDSCAGPKIRGPKGSYLKVRGDPRDEETQRNGETQIQWKVAW